MYFAIILASFHSFISAIFPFLEQKTVAVYCTVVGWQYARRGDNINKHHHHPLEQRQKRLKISSSDRVPSGFVVRGNNVDVPFHQFLGSIIRTQRMLCLPAINILLCLPPFWRSCLERFPSVQHEGEDGWPPRYVFYLLYYNCSPEGGHNEIDNFIVAIKYRGTQRGTCYSCPSSTVSLSLFLTILLHNHRSTTVPPSR